MTKDEWRIVRVAIQWLLDERINLPINDKTKITSIDDLRGEMVGWQFEVILSGTTGLTEKALHDAIEAMAVAHSLVAMVQVQEPSDDVINTLKVDLQVVSKSIDADIKAHQYLKTVGTLLTSIEPLISKIT